MICTNCFEAQNVSITTDMTVTINGVPQVITVECEKCPECGEITFTHAQSLEVDKKRISLEFGNKPILSPQQLKTLRQFLKMTLDEICDVLQIGKNSYGRWERGEVEITPSMNLLVHNFIEKVPNAKFHVFASDRNYALSNLLARPMNSIDDVLSAFDTSVELFQERDVANKIRTFFQEIDIEKPDSSQLSDLLAFEFMETVSNDDSQCKTHFRPHVVLTDGTEYPSTENILPEMIENWETRAKQLNHPILKARYAGLVWDLKKMVTGNKPSIEFAQIMIDSNLTLSNIIHEKSVDLLITVLIPKKLAWGLTTATSVSDPVRTRKAVEAMIAYEDRVSKDDTPATWGFSFDNLISNKRAGLTDEERAKILDDLEKRLERISATFETGNPKKWCVEHAAIRLSQFYRQQNKLNEARRVILKYGEALKSLAEMSTPLIASSHYEELRSLYQDYGLVDEAKSIDVKLQEIGPEVVANFKKVRTPFQIPQEQFEGYIAQLLDGDLKTVLCKIGFEFIPNKEKAETGLRSIASQCVMTYNIRRQMYDADGRLVANLDSIDSDLNGHLIAHISQLMQFEIPFLHHALSGFIEKFELTTDKILELIFDSPIFEPHKKEFFESGIQAYLDDNHLVAAHLLIPQIEAGIRNLLKLAGGAVIRPNKKGGFDYRTLGDLLGDELLNKILQDCFGKDFVLYFKILFGEKLGWNIRNDICHGITRAEALQKPVTDRIIHVLLLLAHVRFAEGINT